MVLHVLYSPKGVLGTAVSSYADIGAWWSGFWSVRMESGLYEDQTSCIRVLHC